MDNTGLFITYSLIVVVQKWKKRKRDSRGGDGTPRRYVKLFCFVYHIWFKEKNNSFNHEFQAFFSYIVL